MAIIPVAFSLLSKWLLSVSPFFFLFFTVSPWRLSSGLGFQRGSKGAAASARSNPYQSHLLEQPVGLIFHFKVVMNVMLHQFWEWEGASVLCSRCAGNKVPGGRFDHSIDVIWSRCSINQSCISVKQDRCMFQYHCKKLFLSNWRNVLTEDVTLMKCDHNSDKMITLSNLCFQFGR